MLRPLARVGAIFVFALAPLAAAATQAADIYFEGVFESGTYDYRIEVPAGFEPAEDREPPGEGFVFTSILGDAELQVWGGEVAANPKTHREDIRTLEMSEGYLLGDWAFDGRGAQVPGRQGNRRVDIRYMEMCEGTTFAMYRLEYDISEVPTYAPIIAAMNQSFASLPDQVCD